VCNAFVGQTDVNASQKNSIWMEQNNIRCQYYYADASHLGLKSEGLKNGVNGRFHFARKVRDRFWCKVVMMCATPWPRIGKRMIELESILPRLKNISVTWKYIAERMQNRM